MECSFDRYIDRTASESAKWRHYGQDVLAMWVADMDFRSPEPVISALRARVEHGVFGYPTELPELRDLIVERMRRRYDWDVDPDWIIFSPGVVVAFNQALHGLTAPGQALMIQTPVYGPIVRAHGNAGLLTQPVPLARDAQGRYEIDFDAMEQAVTPQTKALMLCNPHNPVGRVLDRQEVTELAAFCERYDLLIVSDEIHNELLMGDSVHTPIASLSPEVAARTVTLMAPSKTFNIAGLKCSVTIISDKDKRERFKAGSQGLVGSINIMGWTAAVAAYKHGQAWLDEMLPYLTDNRDYTKHFVDQSLPGVSMWSPEGTYLAWLDCRDTGLEDPFTFFLEEAKVGMNAGTDYGPEGQGFVRLNYGCCRETLSEALYRMAEALSRI